MTGDIGIHPTHKTEQSTLSADKPLVWITPLSCVTIVDIRATGPNSAPGNDSGGTSSLS